MYIFLYYFMIFFIYSILGWIIETACCSFYAKRAVLNRGFLFGPYLPIYGTAALLMTLFLTEYKDNAFNLFIMAVVYASLLEYFTSWLMEKLFKARWWDYTNIKFNLNGRICLKNCLLFGVLGFILLYATNPILESTLKSIPTNIFYIVSIILIIIFIVDLILTTFILSRLNLHVRNIKKDSTQDIDKQVKLLVSKYTKQYKRIFKAFPRLRYTSESSNAIVQNIKKNFEELDSNLKKRKNKIKEIKRQIRDLRRTKNKENIKIKKKELKKTRKEEI